MRGRRHRGPASCLGTLRQLPMFAGFSPGQLERIDGLTAETAVTAGQALTRQGSTGREAFIVLHGRADVLIDGEVVATVVAGDVVGEMALLDGQPRSATVVAATDMRVLVLDRGQFAELVRDPRAALAIAGCVARRTQHLEQRLAVS